MDTRERTYNLLKEYFDRQDMDIIRDRGKSVFSTEYGLYGSSSLMDCFELFKRIKLDRFDRFIDLGSGDGRIVLLASLFTRSTGIEGDRSLHRMALHAREELGLDADFICTDYTQEDLSGYDCIFIYADHDWPETFQKKLLRECNAVLLSRHNIYRPGLLEKGRTYHIGHIPFVSYHLGRKERRLC